MYSVECVGRLPRGRWACNDDDWIKTPGLHTDENGQLLTEVVNQVRISSGSPFVSRARPSFLVVGTDKSRGAHQVPAVLRSREDLALRRIVMPCIIVKKECRAKDGFVFVATVKNPQSSLVCFEVATALKKEKDQLIILWVKDETTTDAEVQQNQAAIDKEIEARGFINTTFVTLERNSGTPMHEAIENWCVEKEVDWLLLSPSHETSDLMSVTHHFVKTSQTNVIICKK